MPWSIAQPVMLATRPCGADGLMVTVFVITLAVPAQFLAVILQRTLVPTYAQSIV